MSTSGDLTASKYATIAQTAAAAAKIYSDSSAKSAASALESVDQIARVIDDGVTDVIGSVIDEVNTASATATASASAASGSAGQAASSASDAGASKAAAAGSATASAASATLSQAQVALAAQQAGLAQTAAQIVGVYPAAAAITVPDSVAVGASYWASSVDNLSMTQYTNTAGSPVATGITAPQNGLVQAIQALLLASTSVVQNYKGEPIVSGLSDASGYSPLYVTTKGTTYGAGFNIGNYEVVSDSKLLTAIMDDADNGKPWLRLYDDGWVDSGWSKYTEPPDPIYQLVVVGPYYPGTNIENPANVALRLIQIGPMNNFSQGIADWIDAAIYTGDVAAGEAAAYWMLKWARYGSMVGNLGVASGASQATAERYWQIPGWGINMYKNLKFFPKGWQTAVRAWFTKIANDQIAVFPSLPANNHQDWCCAAILACYLNEGTQANYDFALAQFDATTQSITSTGLVPSEAIRDAQSLNYHDFILNALVCMCEIAAQLGEDWYSRNGGTMHLLADAVISGYSDPVGFRALLTAGGFEGGNYAQNALTGDQSFWIPFYARRYPEKFVGFPLALDSAEFNTVRIGGNATKLAALWIPAATTA